MALLTRRFNDALVYAAESHQGQTRKGTDVPYVAHVLAVASLALEYGANEDEAIAALLHDTAEDCGGRPKLEDVRKRFGDAVAEIVEGCTDTFESPKPPWLERKKEYIKSIDDDSPSTMLVCACDKLHNVRSLIVAVRNDGEAAWKRFKGGKDGTLWYYREVLAALKRRGLAERLAHELDIAVAQLHRIVGSPLEPTHVE